MTVLKYDDEYRTLCYRRYVDTFVPFQSSDHLKRVPSYLNSCHVNMSFTIETEQDNKTSFLDVTVLHEQGKFTTSVYRKPIFSGICAIFVVKTHFDSFLRNTYKSGMIYTLVNRCFQICSNWSMLHSQLTLLRLLL